METSRRLQLAFLALIGIMAIGTASTLIEEGDNLIVVGTPGQLEVFEDMAK